MTKAPGLYASLVSIIIALAASACGNTSATEHEKIEGTEWNVTVKRVVQNIDGNGQYTVADTARINKGLNLLPQNPNITIGWTIPSADGKIWLVAYENEPVLNEKVKVTEAYSIPSHEGDIQVTFKFSDAKKWSTITKENIGKRLAVLVDGQLMNAPQVNTEITAGNCAVSIPSDLIHSYLPHLDLNKLER